VSCADTQTPETTLTIQSRAKIGFLSASQTEVFCLGSLATRKDQEKLRKIKIIPIRHYFKPLMSRQGFEHLT
jgi:hypothetical protein